MAIVFVIALLVLLSGLDGSVWREARAEAPSRRPRAQAWRSLERQRAVANASVRWWWE